MDMAIGVAPGENQDTWYDTKQKSLRKKLKSYVKYYNKYIVILLMSSFIENRFKNVLLKKIMIYLLNIG